MKNLLSKKKGFTLIELLVVLGIILILSYMAINGYMDYRKNTLLSLAGDNLLSQINEQKTRTVYGEIEDRDNDGAKCYGVYFDENASVHSFIQEFDTKKELIDGDWAYKGCEDIDFNNIDTVPLEMDEMLSVVSLELDNDLDNEENLLDSVSGEFAIRFDPINGDIVLFGGTGEALEITLQYGELTDHQTTFTYNF